MKPLLNERNGGWDKPWPWPWVPMGFCFLLSHLGDGIIVICPDVEAMKFPVF